MADVFASYRSGLESPASNAAAVTPNDSTDLETDARALWVGTSGNVKIDTTGGQTVTFVGVIGGSIVPMRTRRVYATGTTASNILAIW